jgi:hypothetical protein
VQAPSRTANDPTLNRIRRENKEVLAGNPGSRCVTREGFLYVVSNVAWEGYLKIGRALDYEDRLQTYNTGDPLRRYKLEFVWYFRDRYAAEREAQRLMLPWWKGGEWYLAPVEEAVAVIKSINK